MELLYTGSAPGQAGEISISGQRFRRGEVYTVDDEFGELLLAKGGFYPLPEFNVFEDEPVLDLDEDSEPNEAAILDAAADCEA